MSENPARKLLLGLPEVDDKVFETFMAKRGTEMWVGAIVIKLRWLIMKAELNLPSLQGDFNPYYRFTKFLLKN